MSDLNANLMQVVESTHLFRDKLLADRTRPGYHFAAPEDQGYPGDVNCCFYARGRYHLMYLYANRNDSFRYGHMSSIDLVHWRSHPDVIGPDDFDGGIFSGGAFVDDDGTCYISYWGLPNESNPNGGVRIAKSSDRNYEVWEKFEDYALEASGSGYTVIRDSEGNDVYVGCADPSNIWKKNGKYYMEHGNLSVLLHFGVSGLCDPVNSPRRPDTPETVKGDWVDLFESDDLHHWRYLHRFYQRRDDDSWTESNEDDMCPVFLPLPSSEEGGEESGKYLQLFISHNKGCQYYIGEYDTERDLFYPESHGRMSWKDEAFFAPEALKAPDNRFIMWAWLHDNLEEDGNDFRTLGWSGVYSMPRSLWLREDGTLGIAPIKEMRMLRYNESDSIAALDPLSCEIELEFEVGSDAACGMYLHMSPDGSEYTKVYYDGKTNELVMDLRNSGMGRWRVDERAPLELKPGEKLTLDIFIDHAIVEVFANKRQAICRRAFTTSPENVCMKVFSEKAELKSLRAWDIMPSNMY